MIINKALFLPWGFVTYVDYVEDSGLFLFVGISFSLLSSFVGKSLCSLISSWWTGTGTSLIFSNKVKGEGDFVNLELQIK